MSERFRRQQQGLGKVAESDGGTAGTPNNNEGAAKPRSAEQTAPTLVCQNAKKKSLPFSKSRRSGFHSHIRLNSGLFVGGGKGG